jgi:4-hydroxy-tetrahydrodipicolinate reductase
MRVAVLGAKGKVGREVLAQIAAAPDLVLGATPARGLLATARGGGDVLVDFSSPGAVMELLDALADDPLPLVIGTTGFSPDQAARLAAEGARRPILTGANFTLGFGAFRQAGLALAAALPGASLTVAETYNAAKKPVASGTTQALVADLGASGRAVETEINRVGDTPGITTLRFGLGVADISLTLAVQSRAAYAAGALAAARWLCGRGNGSYSPFDIS